MKVKPFFVNIFQIFLILSGLVLAGGKAAGAERASEEALAAGIYERLGRAKVLTGAGVEEARKQWQAGGSNVEKYRQRVREESWTEVWPDEQGVERTVEVKGEIWTEAIQAALDENPVVYIPAREKPYYLDGPLILHTGNTLAAEAKAEMRLRPGSNCCMVRNEKLAIEKEGPAEVSEDADRDIVIDGGIWTTLATTPGQSNGNENGFGDRQGTIQSHGTILLNQVRGVRVGNLTIRQCRPHGVQMSRCEEFVVEDIRFEEHRRDGVHINGPAHWGIIRRISGTTYDDMVGLLPWDWKHTAIGFGTIDHVLVEEVEAPGPASIRLLPGTKLYPSGQKAACDVADVVFRGIRGISEYKMYDQPNLELGRANDYADPIGNLYNVYFRQIEVRERTAEAPFQAALNADGLSIREVVLGFDPAEAGRPEYKLVQVGPKSMTIKFAENDPGQWVEVFSPDRDCMVKNFTLAEVRARYGAGAAGQEKILEPRGLVAVVTQKLNPDYPNSTPKGGTGRGVLLWENDLSLQVMSFNIRYGTANDGDNHWEKRKELVFEVLREERPDVAGLQEALRFQIDQIRQALPVYQEIGVGRDDGKEKGEYSVILYRQDRFQAEESGTFWFSDTPEVAGSRHWGNDCVRICSWVRLIEKTSRRAFYIYNLHLDHQSQPSREKSVQLLVQRIRQRKHPDPVIVTGDFNAEEDNPAVLYLQGKYAFAGKAGELSESQVVMLDSFRVLHPDVTEVGTFHGFEGRSEGGKIDYIFVSRDAPVQKAEIVSTQKDGRYPSDHFPVTAQIVLPGDIPDKEP